MNLVGGEERLTGSLQLPGFWSNSYWAQERWLLFSPPWVVVMVNKYFSIFQQWTEPEECYLSFNLGRSDFLWGQGTNPSFALGATFLAFFLPWNYKAGAKGRGKVGSWNQLAQMHWCCLIEGQFWDTTKDLNWFYLTYTGSFACHSNIEISVTVCIPILCSQISVAAAAAIINSAGLGIGSGLGAFLENLFWQSTNDQRESRCFHREPQ